MDVFSGDPGDYDVLEEDSEGDMDETNGRDVRSHQRQHKERK